MLKIQCSGVFQNNSFTPLPVRSIKGFFSDTYCGNVVELLEIKLIIWVSSVSWASLEFLTELFALSLQQFVSYSSDFSASALVPMEAYILESLAP